MPIDGCIDLCLNWTLEHVRTFSRKALQVQLLIYDTLPVKHSSPAFNEITCLGVLKDTGGACY